MQKSKLTVFSVFIIIALLGSCGSKNNDSKLDANNVENNFELSGKRVVEYDDSKHPVVLVFNFHLTNRCPSCIAIEEVTTKTLKSAFATEMSEGRVKQYVLNVDEKANKAIANKYEAYGASIFVTRSFQGKETTTELTGDGFKLARNKPDMFAEILIKKIKEYLK